MTHSICVTLNTVGQFGIPLNLIQVTKKINFLFISEMKSFLTFFFYNHFSFKLKSIYFDKRRQCRRQINLMKKKPDFQKFMVLERGKLKNSINRFKLNCLLNTSRLTAQVDKNFFSFKQVSSVAMTKASIFNGVYASIV